MIATLEFERSMRLVEMRVVAVKGINDSFSSLKVAKFAGRPLAKKEKPMVAIVVSSAAVDHRSKA